VISDVEWTPEAPANSDKLTITANITGDVSEVEFEYSLCTEGACGVPEYEMMEAEENSTIYTITVGGFSSDTESIHFRIIARDPAGNQVKTSLIDLEYGLGSSSGEDGFFAENGTLAISGGFAILLAVILGAMYVKNSRSNKELEELLDRLAQVEEAADSWD
jgi:hypothetical protein